MENNNEQKTLMDHYEGLPEDVKNAIFSVESAEVIQKIGKDYKLNVRQVGILADEAGLLMMGVSSPQDFVKNLSQRLDADKDTVQKIVQEVNTRIFAKIRESLRNVHGLSDKGKEEDESKKEKGEETPISQIIKPRSAPFVVSGKKPEMEETPEPIETEQKKPSPVPVEIKPTKKPETKPVPENLPAEKEPEKETKETSLAAAPEKKPESAESKNVFEERKKEEGFRSKPTFTEVKLPETKPNYKGGNDPYREPVD